MTQPRLIKKYPNRRLYDTSQSSYITLNDVRKLVIEETPFTVVDRQTNKDITRSILLQIIMEQESGGKPLFSADLLVQFIRNYDTSSPNSAFSPFLEESMKRFKENQDMFNEQFEGMLGGESLDTWVKMNEQNMQIWNEMQQTILKNFVSPKK